MCVCVYIYIYIYIYVNIYLFACLFVCETHSLCCQRYIHFNILKHAFYAK